MASDFDYIVVSGQVWMREYVPDVGERWVRLVRSPSSERNTRTLDRIRKDNPIIQPLAMCPPLD